MPENARSRVLITGGASGIGLATALAFRSRSASVAVIDRDETAPEGFIFHQADVTDDVEVRLAVSHCISELGGLDVLVNSAGIGAQGTVSSNSDKEWHDVYDVNVVGMARVIRAALPDLLKSESAVIVNVCSIAATVGLPDRVLYSATKGAVLSMTLAMAADFLPLGVRVNAVNPGTTSTPWIERLLGRTSDPVAERAALESRQPHGRLVEAEEVAEAIIYLASESAGSTTGTYIAVDGGMQRLRVRAK
jgi:2-keto-3-deoxy-L-fuconate dehydrogenase